MDGSLSPSQELKMGGWGMIRMELLDGECPTLMSYCPAGRSVFEALIAIVLEEPPSDTGLRFLHLHTSLVCPPDVDRV